MCRPPSFFFLRLASNGDAHMRESARALHPDDKNIAAAVKAAAVFCSARALSSKKVSEKPAHTRAPALTRDAEARARTRSSSVIVAAARRHGIAGIARITAPLKNEQKACESSAFSKKERPLLLLQRVGKWFFQARAPMREQSF